MSDSSSLSVGQAVGRWLLHSLVFVLAGGLAAGISSLVYERISSAQNDIVVYGLVFAASGWIAYQQSKRILDDG